MPDEHADVVRNLVAEWLRWAKADLQVASLTDATSLTRYAVATRYPGEEDPVGRDEAREAATLAAQVFGWGVAQIQVSGVEDRSQLPEQ